MERKQWSACWAANQEVRSSNLCQGRKIVPRFLLHLHRLANSAMKSTMTIHHQWKDEMVRERTGHPPSCAKA